MEGIKLGKSMKHLHNKIDSMYLLLACQAKGIDPESLTDAEVIHAKKVFSKLNEPPEKEKADPKWEDTKMFDEMKAMGL